MGRLSEVRLVGRRFLVRDLKKVSVFLAALAAAYFGADFSKPIREKVAGLVDGVACDQGLGR